MDAIEGEEYEGTITSVSSEASSGSSSAKYPVEITFDKTDDMRIGMTASASISIDEAKEVETGLSNGNKVEISSGLESGDTVYYLKTTSSSSSNSQQDMQGGPGGNGGEAPSDMGGSGGPGGDGGEAPSDMGGNGGPGGQSGNSSN